MTTSLFVLNMSMLVDLLADWILQTYALHMVSLHVTSSKFCIMSDHGTFHITLHCITSSMMVLYLY